MANEYATLTQLKDALSSTGYSGADAALELALAAASRQIDKHTGRRFWQDATVKTRQYDAFDSTVCYVDDISTATGLIVAVDDDDTGAFGTTLTISSNFVLLPRNAADEDPAEPYTEIAIVDTVAGSFPRSASGRAGVQVTAQFGWPAVPDDVTQACLIQAVQLFKGPAAPFGGVELGEGGGVLRLRQAIHPQAEALLEGYSRPRVA